MLAQGDTSGPERRDPAAWVLRRGCCGACGARIDSPISLRLTIQVLPGDSESALRCLVLNTMQIDPDRAAPWSLEVRSHPMRARTRPRRHLPYA